MRIAYFVAVMAITIGSAWAQDIGGGYRVEGTNLDGSTYAGTARITPTSDTTCRIAWVTGGTTSAGICMVDFDVVAAGYELNGEVGLVIYELMDDGSLAGVWTIADRPGVGYEVLTPMK